MEPDCEDVSTTPNPEDDIFEDSFNDFSSSSSRTTATDDQGDQYSPSSSVASFTQEIASEASSSQPTLRRRLISGKDGLTHDRPSLQSRFSEFREKKKVLRSKSNQISNEAEVIPPYSSANIATEESTNNSEPLEGNDSFLELVAGLLLKAIVFQFLILFKILLSPLWILFKLYKLAIDPLGSLWRLRESLLLKMTGTFKRVLKKISPVMENWLKEHDINVHIAWRFGWGFLWAIYVATVISALLGSSFILSMLLLPLVIEKPLQFQAKLNFDYTEIKPLAHVPLIAAKGSHCDAKNGDKTHFDTHFYLSKRTITLAIALTLPESDHNTKLGNFQVRVKFLNNNGEVLGVLIQSGILKFKSQFIRAITTVLKTVPIITGYVSEAQTIVLKVRNYRLQNGEVSCLTVALEQRAGLLAGFGIPEIYEGFISIDSELPFVKKVLWNWKRSVFVWFSILSFLMHLLFVMVTCRKLIMPSTRILERVEDSPS